MVSQKSLTSLVELADARDADSARTVHCDSSRRENALAAAENRAVASFRVRESQRMAEAKTSLYSTPKVKIAGAIQTMLAARWSVHDGDAATVATAVAAIAAYLVHVSAYSKANSSYLQFQLNCQNCENRAN